VTIPVSVPRGGPAILDGWQRLALAVINKAAIDAAAGDLQVRAWLGDPDNPLIAMAGINRRAVLRWLGKGCKLSQRTKEKLKPKNSQQERLQGAQLQQAVINDP
jgi:hypothetical protein